VLISILKVNDAIADIIGGLNQVGERMPLPTVVIVDPRYLELALYSS
jgi:hypothetical protein